ncbi:MAG: aspartate/glutamate racemase family protein [Maribacter sp.]|uniref:aspartate/glutamate racemase family protein n=1 Tax=Maribacter sp. TaxID=1897614 RepID=UPI0032969125
MKTIGLIGGVSWESSKVYYEYTNRIIRDRLGGSHSAKSMLNTVDFAEIEELTFKGNWDGIGDIIANEASKLEQSGAELILICSNLIHIVSERVKEATSIPFLHIAHATGAEIKKKNLCKIALLGTKFTMEKDFYSKILEDAYGLEILIPEKQERELLNEIIYKELVRGIFTEASKQRCIEIIEKLMVDGAEGVILGCTELPLLISKSDVSIPTFDTARIHVEKAIDFALAD